MQEINIDSLPLNMQKYMNYNEQFKRLDKALSNNFYLEALFIEYAIMEDRTEAILRYEGNEIIVKEGDFVSINKKLKEIKKLSQKRKSLLNKYFSDDLIDRILAWKELRNTMNHELMEQYLTTEGLEEMACEGKILCRQLCNKANNYKRVVERKKEKN